MSNRSSFCVLVRPGPELQSRRMNSGMIEACDARHDRGDGASKRKERRLITWRRRSTGSRFSCGRSRARVAREPVRTGATWRRMDCRCDNGKVCDRIASSVSGRGFAVVGGYGEPCGLIQRTRLSRTSSGGAAPTPKVGERGDRHCEAWVGWVDLDPILDQDVEVEVDLDVSGRGVQPRPSLPFNGRPGWLRVALGEGLAGWIWKWKWIWM
jgi:hypothetical protein